MIRDDETTRAYQSLCDRVQRVAKLHRNCAVTEGAGSVAWQLGAALFAVVLLQDLAGLPLIVRVITLPLLSVFLVILAWRRIVRPLLEKYSLSRAAMLVESSRPELNSRVVSALGIYADLEREKPHFDRTLVEAAVIHAQRSTQDDDFCAAIDRGPSKRQLMFAGGALLAWIAAFAIDSAGFSQSLLSLAGAWREMGDVIAEAGGARIAIDPLDRRAFLVGSDIYVRGTQMGFHSDAMSLLVKAEGETKFKPFELLVDPAGKSEYLAKAAGKSFECYFESGRFKSEHLSVVVTERPRIVNLKAETELPAYAHRAPIIEPRSDGNLKHKLYGSTIVLTLEANKKLKTCAIKKSYADKADELAVNGPYARAVIRLNNEAWLTDEALLNIAATYTLKLTDEYGYSNEDPDHAYELSVVKDEAPKLKLIALPHKSAKDEPHVLEQTLGNLGIVVQASDDCGVARVTAHYRIESLESNAEKAHDTRTVVFPLPQPEVPQLSVMRLAETGAKVGDRIVFWAEAEDAYDLEPQKGPHKARTPEYRIAVVTEEEQFKDIVHPDTWAPRLYDDLKIVTLAARDVPVRVASESEPAAAAAQKLLNAPQLNDSVRVEDQQLIQDYYKNLNVLK